MIKIARFDNPNCKRWFNRLRRTKWKSLLLLVDGEWAESTYHQGKVKYWFWVDASGQIACVESKKILAVATFEPGDSHVMVVQTLAAAATKSGFNMPTLIDDSEDDDIDPEILWELPQTFEELSDDTLG